MRRAVSDERLDNGALVIGISDGLGNVGTKPGPNKVGGIGRIGRSASKMMSSFASRSSATTPIDRTPLSNSGREITRSEFSSSMLMVFRKFLNSSRESSELVSRSIVEYRA